MTSIVSQSAIDVTADGQVLFEKNPDRLIIPASVAKLFVAHVAREVVTDSRLDDLVTVQSSDHSRAWGPAQLQEGDQLSFRDIFYASLLPSHDSFSYIVARAAGDLMPGPGTGISRFMARLSQLMADYGYEGAVLADTFGQSHQSRLSVRHMTDLMLKVAANDSWLLGVTGARQRLITYVGPNPRTRTVTHTINPDGDVPLPEFVGGKTGTLDNVPVANIVIAWEDSQGRRRATALLGSTRDARYPDLRLIMDGQATPDRPPVPPGVPFRRRVDSPWSYEIVRTRDGARQGRVTPTDFGSWARRLDGKSTGRHSFHLGEDPSVWSRMRPARRTLVVCYDNEPVYAGVIWAAVYNQATRAVELAHEDVWSVLERRMAIPRDTSTPAAAFVRFTDINRRTHAKRVLQMAMTDPTGSQSSSYSLPILLPADESGSWTFSWRGYDLHTAASGLERVAKPGGPMQVDFPMVWAFDGSFRWELQVTHDSQEETHLYVEPDESPALSLSLAHDMTDYASELNVTGSGQGADTLQRFHWLGNVGGDLVALAVDHSDGTIDSDDELVNVRDGLADRHRVATVQADVTVALGEGGFSPHDFTLGQQVRIHLNDDPIIPRVDGGHRFMLIGYAPGGPGKLKLELAPIDGFTGYDTGEPTFHYRNLNKSQVQDQSARIHRAERRLVYPVGGALAAATSTQEGI